MRLSMFRSPSLLASFIRRVTSAKSYATLKGAIHVTNFIFKNYLPADLSSHPCGFVRVAPDLKTAFGNLAQDENYK